MARPIKKGLDFFPLDVSINDNLELLEAECGLNGFAIVIKLWQKIYKNSYYIEWKEDNALLFARKINTELTLVNSVINACFKRDLFNKTIYDKYKILTSTGIQKRYIKICNESKRKNCEIKTEFNLINSGIIPEETIVNSELTEETVVNPEETPINSEFSTQSKVKESKVNKSKVNKSKVNKKNKKDLTSLNPKKEKKKNDFKNLKPEKKEKQYFTSTGIDILNLIHTQLTDATGKGDTHSDVHYKKWMDRIGNDLFYGRLKDIIVDYKGKCNNLSGYLTKSLENEFLGKT
jgi:hypothetical protein